MHKPIDANYCLRHLDVCIKNNIIEIGTTSNDEASILRKNEIALTQNT